MKLPTLSIVIPNYNHAHYLPNCLSAILHQSVPADEVIVIDDASTDNSLEVLEGFARKYPQLKYYRNEKNMGFMGAVNRGLDLATGEVVCMPGADDEVSPGFFEKSLRVLAENPDAGLSGTICEMYDTGTGMKYYFGNGITDRPRCLPPAELVELARQSRLMLFSATMIYRREPLLKAGKYIAALKWHCDWFLFVVVGLRHGICFVPEVLGQFRIIHEGVSKKGMKKVSEQMAVLRALLELFERDEFQDVVPLVRDGAFFASFGKEMFWLLLTHRRHWKYLTPGYLRSAAWWIIRIEAKKILPKWVAGLYFKLGGFSKAPAAKPSA